MMPYNLALLGFKGLLTKVINECDRDPDLRGLARQMVGVQMTAARAALAASSWNHIKVTWLPSIALEIDAIRSYVPTSYSESMRQLRTICPSPHVQ